MIKSYITISDRLYINLPLFTKRYRLGKITDIKNDLAETKSKLFVIQPQLIDANNNNLTASHPTPHDDTDPNKRSQLVSRPNIRLISPPWFFEYQHELSLKSFKQVQLNAMFATRRSLSVASNPYFTFSETNTVSPDNSQQQYQKQNSIQKILSANKQQQEASLPAG